MDLCRCGHLLECHLIVSTSLKQTQSCHAGTTLTSVPICQCLEIIPMTNVEYLEYKYEQKESQV
jgi:hypothetical protein